jgi:hypothetical protein
MGVFGGTEDGKAAASSLLVLQGATFWRSAVRPRRNVVHLDPRRFRARLPDRDV